MSLIQNDKIRQVTETTIVIGVDIASETHWARAFDRRGLELGKVISFENSAEGFQQFTRLASEIAMNEQKDHAVVGAEPTGHYWFTLSAYLQNNGAKLVLVNPISRKTQQGAGRHQQDLAANEVTCRWEETCAEGKNSVGCTEGSTAAYAADYSTVSQEHQMSPQNA